MTDKANHGAPASQGKANPPASDIAQASGAARVSAWSLMPKTSAARKVLRQRAQLLARQNKQTRQDTLEHFVCFRLGPSERYGIAYAYLEEIAHCLAITRVPCTPPAIAGVANYRGELLTVLDLKHLFRTEEGGRNDVAQVIVTRSGGMRVGLIVDEVEGNDTFVAASLAPPLPSAGVSNLDYVQGIHQGRVAILNIAALLADLALCVDEAVK